MTMQNPTVSQPVRLNPYFIGLSILIGPNRIGMEGKTVVSILILLDYLFL